VNDPANLGTTLFGYELKYFNPQNTANSTGKYNGNIAEVTWATATDGVKRRYNYQYDALNRLTKGLYSEPEATAPQDDFYNETVTYDMNSNILSLQRKGKNSLGLKSDIDLLSYAYTNNGKSNRLNSITDSSTNYSGYPDVSGNTISYDDNGNMTNQTDKGILDIKYNFLNLPDYVKFDKTFIPRFNLGGDYNVNTQYLYRADGTKLKKSYTYGSGKLNGETATVTEYLDGFQYEATSSTGKFNLGLKFVPTAEGYYNFENNKYIYSYTDHLGNVRVSYFNNGSGAEVLEENNYYPFGMRHEGYNNLPGNPAYKYNYNGKELQKETGMYDYGARMYMPDLGRWGVIDNKAEKYFPFSSYTYAINNPIKYLDPDGNDVIIWYKASDGKMHSYDYKYGANYTGKNKYLIAFHNSANALIKAGAGENLKELDSKKEKVWVRDDIYDKNTGPAFYEDRMSITWKPTEGLDTDGDSNLTATVILDHEMDHTLGFLNNPEEYHKRLTPNGTDYDNEEEKRVITGSEQNTARKLGLTTPKQTTRKNHRGNLYDTGGVNTIKRKANEIQEVTITVKRKVKTSTRGSESDKKRTPL
jgi:RHS repeat-associated protein